MNKEQLQERTKQFAHRCVKLCASLPKTYLANHIRGQLIRCSTSVASNYRAACLGRSKPEFIAKIGIVLEETDESSFWLEFIIDEKLLKKAIVTPLFEESEELTAIFIASQKTSRKNTN